MVIECDSNWVLTENHSQPRKKDEFMLAVDFQCLHNSSSNDKSSTCGEEAASLNTSYSDIESPIIIRVDDNIHGRYGLNESNPALQRGQNIVSVAMDLESEDQRGSDGSDPKLSAALLDQLPGEKKTLSSGPLWGFSSICGKRPEMEDAIAVKPKLFQVPSQMLMDGHVNENTKYSSAHFFGVYDGHGGFQVLIKNHSINYTSCIAEVDSFH